MTGLGEQQHKLELLKARDPGQHSRTDHADTSWGQAPGRHFSAGSLSSNLLHTFWKFHAISVCHTASSQFGVNSVMSEGWGRTKTELGVPESLSEAGWHSKVAQALVASH